MATVKEKVAGIKAMEDRIEADVARIEKEILGETDWMRKGIAEMHRETREIEARFDNYARDDFWG